MEIEPNRLYTVKECQEIFHTSRNTLLRLLATGELPASRPGRSWLIRGEDILRFHERKAAERRPSPGAP